MEPFDAMAKRVPHAFRTGFESAVSILGGRASWTFKFPWPGTGRGGRGSQALASISRIFITTYFTMDTDPSGTFDFRSFEDMLPETCFDVVIADQVLEHMPVEDAFGMVSEAFRHLSDGGSLLASVPNTAHPVRQWDCTHVTAWAPNDLYSLLRSAGFFVKSMSRFNKYPLTTNPFKRWVVNTVCSEFRVDWCDSIMVVGQRNG